MAKRFKRTHKVHEGKKVNMNFGTPKAYAADSPNQFNPQGWQGDQPYGTPHGNTPHGNTTPPPTVKKITYHQQTTGPTVYLEDKHGKRAPLTHVPTLQERQRIHASGYKLTTTPPTATGYVGDVNTPDYLRAAYNMGGNQSSDPNLQAASSVNPTNPTAKQVYNPKTGYMEDVPLSKQSNKPFWQFW